MPRKKRGGGEKRFDVYQLKLRGFRVSADGGVCGRLNSTHRLSPWQQHAVIIWLGARRFELIRWGLLRLTNMSETVTAPRLTQTWRRGRLGCSVSQVPPLFFPLSHPPLPSISSHFTPHSTDHERNDFFFSSTPQEQPQKPDAAQSTSARHVCVCIGERSPPFSSRHPQTDRITKRKHQHVVRFCPVSRTRRSWHRGLGKLGSPNK